MILVKQKKNLAAQKSTKMLKILIAVLFTCFTLAASPAVVKPVLTEKNTSIRNDTSRLSVRSFDEQKIKEYSRESAFKYDETPAESWWDRFWKWFWEVINGILTNKYSGSFLKYLVMAAVVALVIFLAIKLLGLDFKMIMGKSKAIAVPFSESLENIHEINFNEQIQQAISNANYRLAVRLCYLRTLKTLNDQSLINWQPEKTNHAYVREIEDPALKKQFSQLTTQFEYIWYGEFFIDKENFGPIKSSFDLFNPLKR